MNIQHQNHDFSTKYLLTIDMPIDKIFEKGIKEPVHNDTGVQVDLCIKGDRKDCCCALECQMHTTYCKAAKDIGEWLREKGITEKDVTFVDETKNNIFAGMDVQF